MKLYEIITKYKDSNKIAIFSNSYNLTYSQLYRRAITFAGMLKKQENADNIIAIYLPNNVDYIASYFAVLLADCTVFPINILTKQEELSTDYNVCRFTYLITDEMNYKKLPDRLIKESALQILVVEHINIDQNGIFPLNTEDMKNNVAMLINTSGTTSNSKIVMLSHDNLLATVDSITRNSTGKIKRY